MQSLAAFPPSATLHTVYIFLPPDPFSILWTWPVSLLLHYIEQREFIVKRVAFLPCVRQPAVHLLSIFHPVHLGYNGHVGDRRAGSWSWRCLPDTVGRDSPLKPQEIPPCPAAEASSLGREHTYTNAYLDQHPNLQPTTSPLVDAGGQALRYALRVGAQKPAALEAERAIEKMLDSGKI